MPDPEKEKLILEETVYDLQKDFEELEYIARSGITQLNRFELNLERVRKSIIPEILIDIKNNINLLISQYNNLLQRLSTAKKDLNETNKSQKAILEASFHKRVNFEKLRALYNQTAAAVTSLDWQSPTASHTLFSQAGSQTGKILATLIDYKRDAHLDETGYEKKFLNQNIDALVKVGIKTYMTASGMAAFTTIFNFLMGEGKLEGKVLLGKSSYFQYKNLLSNPLDDRIIEFDEIDLEKLKDLVKKVRPSAIFIDSLCNTADLPFPDLKSLIKYMEKECDWNIFLVIDNTCLSTSFQPFRTLSPLKRNIGLIVFESLMKYHHFGMDRTTGGIIVARGKDIGKLYDWRKNSGTNITDMGVYQFPIPNRKMLDRRLKRFSRNTSILTQKLQQFIDTTSGKYVNSIIYPVQKPTFTGSFFNIGFTKPDVKLYKQFIKSVMEEAKRAKVEFHHGTSFGLNHTRIYLTSLWTKYGDPFIRISVGTENRLEIEKILTVLEKTVRIING
ncbi:PLP-dependent transferase [Patescibacteria group bacterium]|nr:PLP-dependent transferase [Patescibacteria group bacterium]MCL5797840.1 PLP-dependent transferase [Patescibacteria group bacterium]